MTPNKKSRKWLLAALTVTLALVIDQWIKFEVKTGLPLGGEIRIADWFYIKFIENNGMAYGMTFINKPVLSVFRIVLISLLGWYTCRQIKKGARIFYVFTLSLIFAGAAGNLLDCMFYGLIFSGSSPFYVSYVVPFGEGYSTFLTGKVVDMFYFPIIRTTWPDWMPIWGGQEYVFFSPVFNFADACISVGFVMLLLFCRRELQELSFETKGKTKANNGNGISDVNAGE